MARLKGLSLILPFVLWRLGKQETESDEASGCGPTNIIETYYKVMKTAMDERHFTVMDNEVAS